MTLDGEITEITSPPNKADRFRGITIWVPATEEHTEITLPVEDFKKAGLAEGDQIAIKLEKKIRHRRNGARPLQRKVIGIYLVKYNFYIQLF